MVSVLVDAGQSLYVLTKTQRLFCERLLPVYVYVYIFSNLVVYFIMFKKILIRPKHRHTQIIVSIKEYVKLTEIPEKMLF